MNVKSHNSLQKIINHTEKVLAYASSSTTWWDDDKSLEAIVFNLAQIGELVRFVETDILFNYKQVNWAAMRGLRNRIIHDYDFINPLVIRGIVKNDLPVLLKELKLIMNSEPVSE